LDLVNLLSTVFNGVSVPKKIIQSLIGNDITKKRSPGFIGRIISASNGAYQRLPAAFFDASFASPNDI
jgi:hypothetical protein